VFDVAIHTAPRHDHVRMSSCKVPFSGNGKELRRHWSYVNGLLGEYRKSDTVTCVNCRKMWQVLM